MYAIRSYYVRGLSNFMSGVIPDHFHLISKANNIEKQPLKHILSIKRSGKMSIIGIKSIFWNSRNIGCL